MTSPFYLFDEFGTYCSEGLADSFKKVRSQSIAELVEEAFRKALESTTISEAFSVDYFENFSDSMVQKVAEKFMVNIKDWHKHTNVEALPINSATRMCEFTINNMFGGDPIAAMEYYPDTVSSLILSMLS